ncbi:type VII secretion protein EccB [Microtetraspora sp. NBRC 13810]|uniref:type VII secretion protein EccB n=1 Tax=Microtetraspora sp. NBRC 13810 TaxID=3030990 RepID=UPI00249F97E2|nr:type VII secretion protein EccB [Microtetraspora sp. NBRC 13810]GLW05001.1 type VII secretion protein EccB [Microtetraspora sp. NBRC 13810]
MQTQKDLYQAHRLMQQRLGMALLQGEPDVPESPMRRHNVGMFAGALVAVLILAGFGIWGLIKPGNATKITDAGQLIVETETGATYVYSQQQNRLLPVANYVSARLLLDSADIKTLDVTSASLEKYARGPVVGIAGAPDSLPAGNKLVRGPWSVCVTEGPDGAGGRKPYVTLVGGTPVGGTPVGGDGMVVDDGRQTWLLWADTRMRVTADGVRMLNAQPRKVPAAWLNSIPEGRDFTGPPVPDRGKKIGGSGGRGAVTVGQVFTVPEVAGAPARWYVMLSDGLAPITLTQARLLLEDPATKKAYGKSPVLPVTIDAATANASPSRQTISGGGLPATMPRMVSSPAAAPLCAVYADTAKGSMRARLTVGSTMTIPEPKAGGDPEHFDQVVFPPGGAAMAGLLPAEGQVGSISNYYLVSEQGRRYALPSPDILGKLGYDTSQVAPLPPNILRLIPEGPALDPAVARSPLQVTR